MTPRDCLRHLDVCAGLARLAGCRPLAVARALHRSRILTLGGFPVDDDCEEVDEWVSGLSADELPAGLRDFLVEFRELAYNEDLDVWQLDTPLAYRLAREARAAML